MNLSKKGFRDYILNQYKPSIPEIDIGNVDHFLPGSNYVSINWLRFYHTLLYFDKYKPDKTERILDVGSYPGSLIRLLKEVLGCNAEMYQTDLSYDGVEWRDIDLPFTFDYPDNFFDFIFVCEVIEHLVSPLYMLKEIRRVLKPNGVLLITTDNQIDIGNAFNLLMGRSINQEITQGHIYKNNLTNRKHIHLYTKDELEYILTDLGFKNVKIKLHSIQHNFRQYTIMKRIKFWIRSMFYVFSMYRPRLFAVCRKK